VVALFETLRYLGRDLMVAGVHSLSMEEAQECMLEAELAYAMAQTCFAQVLGCKHGFGCSWMSSSSRSATVGGQRRRNT
jgi:hypothetical protein